MCEGIGGITYYYWDTLDLVRNIMDPVLRHSGQ